MQIYHEDENKLILRKISISHILLFVALIILIFFLSLIFIYNHILIILLITPIWLFIVAIIIKIIIYFFKKPFIKKIIINKIESKIKIINHSIFKKEEEISIENIDYFFIEKEGKKYATTHSYDVDYYYYYSVSINNEKSIIRLFNIPKNFYVLYKNRKIFEKVSYYSKKENKINPDIDFSLNKEDIFILFSPEVLNSSSFYMPIFSNIIMLIFAFYNNWSLGLILFLLYCNFFISSLFLNFKFLFLPISALNNYFNKEVTKIYVFFRNFIGFLLLGIFYGIFFFVGLGFTGFSFNLIDKAVIFAIGILFLFTFFNFILFIFKKNKEEIVDSATFDFAAGGIFILILTIILIGVSSLINFLFFLPSKTNIFVFYILIIAMEMTLYATKEFIIKEKKKKKLENS
jgi:hypothetical protein